MTPYYQSSKMDGCLSTESDDKTDRGDSKIPQKKIAKKKRLTLGMVAQNNFSKSLTYKQKKPGKLIDLRDENMMEESSSNSLQSEFSAGKIDHRHSEY